MSYKATTKSKHDKPVILIHGEDEFHISSMGHEIINNMIPSNEQDFGLTVIDGNVENISEALSSIGKCIEAMRTSGFLGRKTVWLRGATFFGQDTISKSKSVQDSTNALAAAISSGLPPKNRLVVTACNVNIKSEFMKACRSQGEVLAFDLQKPWRRDNDAIQYTQSAFMKYNLRAPENVIIALVEKAGTDTRLLDQEIRKLSIFLGTKKQVSMNDIDSIISVSKESFVWMLQDAVGKKDFLKSFKILQRLLFQNESPIGLIMCIENRFRQLLIFREALDKRWIKLSKRGKNYTTLIKDNMPKSTEQLFMNAVSAEKGRITSFQESILAAQADGFKFDELIHCREMIMEARRAMVSSSASPIFLLKTLIIKLCRAKHHQ